MSFNRPLRPTLVKLKGPSWRFIFSLMLFKLLGLTKESLWTTSLCLPISSGKKIILWQHSWNSSHSLKISIIVKSKLTLWELAMFLNILVRTLGYLSVNDYVNKFTHSLCIHIKKSIVLYTSLTEMAQNVLKTYLYV